MQSVAATAQQCTCDTGLGQALVAAAWLHDIGYAKALHETGFHPVDGARYLHDHGWDPLVVSMVAHHTCARFEAHLRGLDAQLAQFPRPPGAYEDALCFCDITSGPGGDRVSAPERLAEIEHRYGSGHVVTGFVTFAREEILACVVRHLGRGGTTHDTAPPH